MKKIVLIFITISLFSSFSTAQTAEWLVGPIYDVISPFHDGIAVVERDGKWGYINEEGKEIIGLGSYNVYDFSENVGVVTNANNMIVVIVDTKGNVIRTQGKLKIDPRFPIFSDGLLLVSDGKNWGYINKTGEMVINCQFKYAKPFSEGLAAVALSEGWFYIDTSNQVVIRCDANKSRYWASGFNAGVAFVLYKNGSACIDKSGNKLDREFASLSAPSEYAAYFAATLSCKQGEIIFDAKNRVVHVKKISGEIIQYSESPKKIAKEEGSFLFNGININYNNPKLFWNSQTMASLSENGKIGLIVLKDNPISAAIDNSKKQSASLVNSSPNSSSSIENKRADVSNRTKKKTHTSTSSGTKDNKTKKDKDIDTKL